MRPCPLCGSPGGVPAFPYQTRWNDKDFFYVSCSKCETTFVDPLPDEADFAKMYSKEHYHDLHYGTLDSRAAAATLEKLQRHRGRRQSLLDYACGAGGFLLAARGFGYDCHGAEYAADVCDAARRNSGAAVHRVSELADTGLRFDVIHMGDILEHLPDPRATMLALERLLAPQGLFVVEGPLQRNASPVYWSSMCLKALRRLSGTDRVADSPPTHLILTSRSAQLDFFVRRMGYDCLHYELAESGWPYHYAGNRIDSLGSGLKSIIGHCAMALHRVDFTGTVGNRFLGVFKARG